jgi:hypothetical protein
VEIAKLVLEFLKVLTWPAVALVVVLLFRPHLERILRQFSDRLGTAETLKLGVMGQEVQISGTAKELAKERALLAQSPTSEASPDKLQAIDRAARELNNPFADLIGLKLLQSKTPIPLENLVHAVVTAMSTGPEPPKHPPMVILAMTREVEKVLATLQSLAYARVKGGEYELTSEGRHFFQRVAKQQGEFLARFNALT